MDMDWFTGGLLLIVAGGWSLNYLLSLIVHKTVPLVVAGVVGLFTGEIAIPIAVIVSILRHLALL